MSLKRSAVLPAMLLIALMSGVSHAQSVGTISGTVTDSTGAIVPGVNVTIKSQGTGVARTVSTSGEGHYTAAILPIGTYTGGGYAPGFQPAEKPDPNPEVAQILTVDVVLKPASIGTEVDV